MKDNPTVTMYFRGNSKIENPKDIDGNEIKEGDVLSNDSFGDKHNSDSAFLEMGWTQERLDEMANRPSYIVRKSSDGFYYADGLKPIYDSYDTKRIYGKRTYLHDFRFKHTKRICHISENPSLFVEYENESEFQS